MTEVKKDSIVKRPISKTLPFFRRLKNYGIYTRSSRVLESSEYSLEFPGDLLDITFYIARKPIYIFLVFPESINLQVKSLRFIKDISEVDMPCGITYRHKDKNNIIVLSPAEIRTFNKISIEFEPNSQRFDINTKLYVVDEEYADWKAYKAAFDLEKEKKYDQALEKAEEYYRLCSSNPYILNLIAVLYNHLENKERALESAIQTATNGLSDVGINYYREIVAADPFIDLKRIKELHKECSDWNIDRHYGTIVLWKEQKYLLGVNGYYVRFCREIYKIRRVSAARMFTRLGFKFSSREFLLAADCRIISKNDKVQVLPDEQFVISDGTDRNIYITMEEDKEANFLLPELSAGDVIEICYHLLYREHYKIEENQPHVFILTNPHHTIFPIFRSTTSFAAPPEWHPQVDITEIADEVIQREYTNENHKIYEISLNKYIPSHQIGCIYESYFKNPAVAYCSLNSNWQNVGRKIFEHNFGETDVNDTLPTPLMNIIEGNQDRIKALQESFYYIRDRIKYASVKSAVEKIGLEGRAKAIVESGVGDCKDKSFLIYQVCQKLGIQAQYLFVSTVHGKIFERLPSDQFDHVFVRVFLDNQWRYLDAANRSSVFNTSPSAMQGVPMLVKNKKFAIENIPCSLPENNHISITETFDESENDTLSGTFHLRAKGNIARYIDENLKWQSLQETGFIRSSQIILEDFMPSSSIKSYDRISHTANSDIFEILGTHNRCRLTLSNHHYFGILTWNDPYVPLKYWRNMKLKGYFTFSCPHIIDINIVLSGELIKKYKGYNSPPDYSNEICDIIEKVEQSAEDYLISRKIIIKEKFIKKDLIHLFPEAMENMEKAFQVAMIFDK